MSRFESLDLLVRYYEASLENAKVSRADAVALDQAHVSGYWSGRVDVLEQLLVDLRGVERWR